MPSRKGKTEAPLDYFRRTPGAVFGRGAKGKVWKAIWGRLRFSRVDGDQKSNSAVESKKYRPRKIVHLPDASPKGIKPTTGSWSESFIFAGGSAFLLLLAILLPHYWYVSFFALTPLLYRILKATPTECLRLGLLFGLFFFGGSTASKLAGSPLTSMIKLILGTIIFTLFGWSLGWARQRWGFNPFILVFLWVGLELGLLKLGFVGGVLGEAGFSHPVFGSLVTIFGCLTVSATIVLFNSLLVLAIVKRRRIAGGGWSTVRLDEGLWDIVSFPTCLKQRVYLVPESRAPP